MKYEDVIRNKPFYILHKDPRKQDITVWRRGEYSLQIFFHGEDFWCNPPTDTNMEYNAQKKIERYGIAYIPEDYVDVYKATPIMERRAYSLSIADKVLGPMKGKK